MTPAEFFWRLAGFGLAFVAVFLVSLLCMSVKCSVGLITYCVVLLCICLKIY